MYVITDTTKLDGVDVLCDSRNLVKTFESQSFDVVICKNLGNYCNLEDSIHQIKSVCKTGGVVFISFGGSCYQIKIDYAKEIFADFYIEALEGKYLKAIKLKLPEVNLAKTKTKAKKIKRKISVPIARYIGNTEIYIPNFKKIVNKGDLVPEMSIEEARQRPDFIVINEEE